MCDESHLCQMFDCLHLLAGLEQGAPVAAYTLIRQHDGVMVREDRGEFS